MRCLHPHCPAGGGLDTWAEVLAVPEMKLQAAARQVAAINLNADFNSPPIEPGIARPTPQMTIAALGRLLRLCPCLFNQIEIRATARAVVHFCELTLGAPVTSQNVHDAFLIQHPTKGDPFNPGPLLPCGDGGKIMEMLCSEILTHAGIPAMPPGADGWPEWQMPGHILMNEAKMSSLQALGDLLIPCAPTNLVISVKSEVARERLLYSANSIEGIGFGFFREPQEFWTKSRMSLFKRMGFTAIYMPEETHASVLAKVEADGNSAHSVNINGTALYRPLSQFGDDMWGVVGRSSALL